MGGVITFNGGEYTPLLDARMDFNKYGAGASYMRNFIPLVQGPMTRRGGTYYCGEVKTSSQKTWLVPFVFSATQAYQLEFGNHYIRFWYNHACILTDAGVPYEVTTPYASADLTDTNDGTFMLDVAQSGDVLYITHPDYPPQKLCRYDHDEWTIAPVDFEGGPFKEYNKTTTTVYASAMTGARITLTASTSIFEAGHVGSLFRLKQKKATSILKWEADKEVNPDDFRRADGKNYKCISGGTTGTNQPTHVEGTEYDGDEVSWEYHDPGYGYCVITAVTSGTVARAEVIDALPSDCIGSDNPTENWAFGSWSDVEGYPSAVTFFRERLCFGMGINFYASESGSFESFYDRNMSGEIVADSAIVGTLASGTINNVSWMAEHQKSLIVGTAGSLFAIHEMTGSEAFGPANCKADFQGSSGAAAVVPIVAKDTVLYLSPSRKQLHEIGYDAVKEKFVSIDMTDLSEHITGDGILQMAYQREPWPINWGARADGLLVGFTYNPEQDVKSWHAHEIGGDAIVESVSVIPAPDGTHDELNMICRRTINGRTKRYIEYMTLPLADGDEIEDGFYVDCGLTYDSTDALTISGLNHLEGESATYLADGKAAKSERIVTDGSILLREAAGLVHVGYACPPQYKSMRLVSNSQGKNQRISKAVLRFLNAVRGKYGPDFDHMDEVTSHLMGERFDTETPVLFSGNIPVEWPGDYETDNYLCIEQPDPYPMTVIALYY
jgi:hypothetical protein